jgi:predicted methyltransferase
MSIARLNLAAAMMLTMALSACTESPAPTTSTTPARTEAPAAVPAVAAPTSSPVATSDTAAPIANAIGGAWRSDEDRSRDAARRPAEVLKFWGLAPGMAILEVQAGAGWWSEILAPYAHANGGSYTATAADLANPELPEAARTAREAFAARFAAKPDIYGTVNLVNFGAKSAPLPAASFDFILTARSVHGWVNNKVADKMFADFFQALKPGGILAIEQHQGNDFWLRHAICGRRTRREGRIQAGRKFGN